MLPVKFKENKVSCLLKSSTSVDILLETSRNESDLGNSSGLIFDKEFLLRSKKRIVDSSEKSGSSVSPFPSRYMLIFFSQQSQHQHNSQR